MLVTELAWKLTKKLAHAFFWWQKKKASWKTTLSYQTIDTEIESLNGGRSFGKANETFCDGFLSTKFA